MSMFTPQTSTPPHPDLSPAAENLRPNATDCDISAGSSPALPPASLTSRQLAAIPLLAAGKSVAVVADALGLHRSTLSRWTHQDPDFIVELHRHRADLLSQASDQFRCLLTAALDTLAKQV